MTITRITAAFGLVAAMLLGGVVTATAAHPGVGGNMPATAECPPYV